MSHKATNWAIQRRGLKPATKIVLWHLCDRHNPDFGCFPTQARLAVDAEMSISALNAHLARLEKMRLIHRVRNHDPRTHKRQATRYILGFEDGFPQKPTPKTGDGLVGTEEELDDDPAPESTHGAISGNSPIPSPDFAQSHLRNPETNLVRERDARRDACARTGHTGPDANAGCAMTMQRRIAHGFRQKRALGVQAILEWAFGREKAQLELPPPPNADDEPHGYGLEYVLIQRAQLGCQVDGGRHKTGSYTHEDAEVVAAIVAGMPDNLGGIRMAIRVAELARAGLTPDWMPGAVPRCVPVETRRNQHGVRATTVVVGTERVQYRGRWRTVEVLACPVIWRPHPEQIAGARRAYEDWWLALGWVRDGMVAGAMLREFEVTAAMPKMRPWLALNGSAV